MKLYPIKTGVVNVDARLVEIVLTALRKRHLRLKDDDIIVLTSKIVSYAEGQLAKLSEVKPSEKAKQLGKRHSLKPEFAELIQREADKIYGGVEKALLTLKNGVLTPNAGIDSKNAPDDCVVLWPKNPKEVAHRIREEFRRKTGKRVAVMIIDSGLVPLRVGTTGLALAVAGFKPIRDQRGSRDVFGKAVTITRHNVADDLASSAHLLMGEVAERVPVVLIRDAPVDFDDRAYDSEDMMIPFEECLFMGTFLSHLSDLKSS